MTYTIFLKIRHKVSVIYCQFSCSDSIKNCGFIDLGMEGYQFTWDKSRGTDNWVKERLNRAFATDDWLRQFLRAKAVVWNLLAPTTYQFSWIPIRTYMHTDIVSFNLRTYGCVKLGVWILFDRAGLHLLIFLFSKRLRIVVRLHQFGSGIQLTFGIGNWSVSSKWLP